MVLFTKKNCRIYLPYNVLYCNCYCPMGRCSHLQDATTLNLPTRYEKQDSYCRFDGGNLSCCFLVILSRYWCYVENVPNWVVLVVRSNAIFSSHFLLRWNQKNFDSTIAGRMGRTRDILLSLLWLMQSEALLINDESSLFRISLLYLTLICQKMKLSFFYL